jgi:signal peptidase I
MHVSTRTRQFLFPTINVHFLLRVAAVAAITVFIFSQVLVPVRIQGTSMEPTYHDGDVGLCWRLRYLWSPPARGDVVAVRYSGPHYMLAKRVVGLAGDTIAFQDGILYRNGEPQHEPYLILPCQWDLPPRLVETGKIYVVGDNRSIPIEEHVFGQTDAERVIGGIL